MKRQIAGLLCIIMIFALTACGGDEFANLTLDVPSIEVKSASIDATGRLDTATAANNKPNDPLGNNYSPQVSWSAVDGATCYAIVMFDESANWLHWIQTGITETLLEQGAYTQESDYVGPYPPTGSGEHQYRIEVFALEQTPVMSVRKLNQSNVYADLVSALDEAGGIIARGYVVGTYSN